MNGELDISSSGQMVCFKQTGADVGQGTMTQVPVNSMCYRVELRADNGYQVQLLPDISESEPQILISTGTSKLMLSDRQLGSVRWKIDQVGRSGKVNLKDLILQKYPKMMPE